jgi:Rab GDP dissociation inhibitor
VHPFGAAVAGTYIWADAEKKVLHLDRNSFYGGEGASVNLTNLYKIFKGGKEPPTEFGHNRDWNIDLIPKFIMSGGKLVKTLLKTRVSKYLEWKCTPRPT